MTHEMTSDEHIADENMMDRALIAIAFGYHHGGPGYRPYPVMDYLPRLVRLGRVRIEERDYGARPFMWVTEGGMEIVEEMEADRTGLAHVEAIRAECKMDRK